MKYQITAYSFALLGYYHFNKIIPIRKLDVYAWIGPSLRIRSGSYDANFHYSGTTVFPVIKAGARYYLKPKFAIFGEGGYDQISLGNFGATFNL